MGADRVHTVELSREGGVASQSQDIHYASYCEGAWAAVVALQQPSFMGAPGFVAPLAIGSDGSPLAVYSAFADYGGYSGFRPTLLQPITPAAR